MTKRVPKLRRLLCIMQACLAARRTFNGCTLSEAWTLLQGTKIANFRARVETTASFESNLFTDGDLQIRRDAWIEYFLNAAGIIDTGWGIAFDGIRKQVAGARPFKLRTDVPKRLPAALLKRWDGYEPRRRK